MSGESIYDVMAEIDDALSRDNWSILNYASALESAEKKLEELKEIVREGLALGSKLTHDTSWRRRAEITHRLDVLRFKARELVK